jgi:hypothetical protein
LAEIAKSKEWVIAYSASQIPLPSIEGMAMVTIALHLGLFRKVDEKFFVLFNGKDEVRDWLGFPKNSGLRAKTEDLNFTFDGF